MKKIWIFSLCLCILFTGCRQRPLEISSKENITENFMEDKLIQTLLQHYIIPYEAAAGGACFTDIEEILTEPATFYSLYAVQQQMGIDHFLNEEKTEVAIPKELVSAYMQAVFGIQPPQEFGDSERIYYQDYVLQEDGSMQWLERYSSAYTLEPWIPDYTVMPVQAERHDAEIVITVERQYQDIKLPSVKYTFVPAEVSEVLNEAFPDGIYRMRSVTAEYSESITKISSPEQLCYLSTLVNSGDKSYQGRTFTLTEDIELKGIPFEPIGSNVRFSYKGENGFCAVFDGQGHAISGLCVQITEDSPYRDIAIGREAGLFGTVKEGSEIKNVTIADAQISAESNAGILAGFFAGKAENCTVSGSIQGESSIGGLIGSITSTMDCTTEVINCHADVQVRGNNSVGGLLGCANYGWFEGCSVSGKVIAIGKSPAYIGGFTGTQTGSVIYNCFAQAQVETLTPANLVGGFAGVSGYSAILDCYCSADATAHWDPVDDAYNGFVQVTALKWNEFYKYYELLKEKISDGYQKQQSSILGASFNQNLIYIGQVLFPENTLAVLVYFPSEETQSNCEVDDSYFSRGKDQFLLLPLWNHLTVSLQQNGEVLYEREVELERHSWDIGFSGFVFQGTVNKKEEGLQISVQQGNQTATQTIMFPDAEEETVVYLTAQ